MGATRNLGYIENLISYDGNDNIGIGGAVNVLYKVTIGGNTLASGTLNIGTVTNAGVDTDKFLVQDVNGTIRFRTGAELASDIGPANLAASTLKHVVKLGETVSKGQAVYVSSADGTNMIVSKASNASEATSSKTLGLVETNGVLNDQVNVITEGLLAGLDTSTAVIGDPVWLGTSGNIIFGLNNKPYAPAHLVFIGVVTRVQQNNGEIFVKVQNGFEIQELHNVQITSTPTDNQVLTYETATSLYKMKTVDGANVTGYALTKTDDTNVTLTLGGSASTSLLRAASLTLGWTGQLAISRGGTGLSALGTDGQLLRVNSGATALEYWTPTYISAAITSLNGLSGATQTFATGTSGTDFGISSSSTTHTFNLPTASATNRGALSSTDWSTFNGKQAALNGTGFVKISGTTISYDNSTYLTSYTETDTLASVTGRGASTTNTISISASSLQHLILANRFHFIGGTNFHITNNAYYDGSFKYKDSVSPASKIVLNGNGTISYDYAPAGTIDTVIPFTTVWSIGTNGSITANSFIKSGGTSSQILMADGSVLTAGTNITISGGTISSTGGSSLNGTGFVRMAGTTVSYITGTSSQFVKADGSLDGTGYEPTVTKGNLTSANTAHLTVTGGSGAIIGSGVNLTILPGAIVNSGLGLTTTGNSGAATFQNAVLNIPNYTLAGLGGVPTNGTGATGTWGISITGSSASSTDALRIRYNDGPRNLSDRLPNTLARTVFWDFVGSSTVGGAGNYAGVMTYIPWDGTTASTGDSSYQMAFMNETGINGTGLPGLRLRKGIDTAWGSWYTFLHAGNYNSYSPTLTGTGASGTWGINISGNAATATTASGVAWTNVSGRPTALSSFTNDSGYITANSTPYFGINNNSNTSGNGISLYGTYTGGEMQYGFMFAGTGTYGTYGDVTGDWATYIMMNNSTTRGWIFRRNQTANVASISGAGNATFAGYVSAGDVYTAGGWFRNHTNNNGIYWSGTGWHLYPKNVNDFYMRSGATEASIHFLRADGTNKNYIHNASNDEIGFLSTSRNWIFRVDNGGSTQVYGSLTVGSSTSSDIYMTDTDESTRRIHTNSGRIGFLTTGNSWGSWCDNSGNWFSDHSMRAPIFYDLNDTGYYLDPNGTSNLNKFSEFTMSYNDMNPMSANSPYAARYAGSALYRNGTMGYGTTDFNVMFSNWGSGFIDSWSSPANAPGGSSHYVGLQGFHYNHVNNSQAYGFQMACAGEANNRFFWRSAWPNLRSWVEMIHSGNISSQTVSNSDMVDGYHAASFPYRSGVTSGYYQVADWLQFNTSAGLYWPSYYGAHFYPNDGSTYTQFRINGQKNSYDGIYCSYSGVNGMMYDSSGNGGVYREANGRWYWYHHVGNNCIGLNTSATSSSYSVYVGGGKGIYIDGPTGAALYIANGGDIVVTSQVSGSNATLYNDYGTLRCNIDFASDGNIIAYSDVRLKENIEVIPNAIDKVSKLRGVTYTRNDKEDKEKRYSGVIAQEVLEVLPEVVFKEGDEYYSVAYGNMVGLLIEAIKEQQNQIEELKSQIKNK